MVDIFYPLQQIADKLTYDIFGIVPDTRLASSVNFIIYDTMKIFVLLVVMIFIVSYIRTYVTPEKTRKMLGGKKELQYMLASMMGAVTPFCSCSSVPLFIGFVKAGTPPGVTFSFLITSPLVNEAAIAALWATMGLKATLIYTVSGILLGVIGRYLISLLKMEKYVADFVYKIKVGDSNKNPKN